MARIADDRSRLLDLASSISDGTEIDWRDIGAKAGDDETTAVVMQLQVVERIARLHGASHGWDSLQIRDTVGRGPNSIVYRSFDPDLDREVALKVVRFGMSDIRDVDRAVKEARLLAQVRHPHLITVLRAERQGHEMGLWLEIIDGVTLAELVRLEGPLSAHAATRVGLEICRALAAMHRAGLVHGKITAHNVMRDRGGRIVLMDPGPRGLAGASDGVANASANTLCYVAPEALAGNLRSRAADTYAVGVLLYYLVTGTFPAEGTIRTESGRRQDRKRPQKPLHEARPDLSPRLVQTIERALHERPEGRFTSASEFERALREALPLASRVLRRMLPPWLGRP